MQDSDRKRFLELMTGLAQTFSVALSGRDIENYWRFLKGYALAQIEQAVMDYCARSDKGHAFMPKPGELIAALRGKGNERALMAWVKVMRAMRQVGASKTIVFDDAIIHVVVDDMGGWPRLCALEEKQLVFQQREFERLYQCYVNRARFNYPRQLTGLFDITNAASGYAHRQNPILFGDAQQAAQVFKNGQESAAPYQALSIQKILQLSEGKALDNNKPSIRKEDSTNISGETDDDKNHTD